MNAKSIELQSIRQHCKTLRMPSVATQFQKIAEQAQRDEHSYVRYLDVLLSAEVEEREHRAVQRRLKEAQLPRAKTLEEFDFSQSPKVSARRIRELAEGELHRPCTAGSVSRRCRHRQDSSGHGIVCSGVPATSPRSLHDGLETRQRTR